MNRRFFMRAAAGAIIARPISERNNADSSVMIDGEEVKLVDILAGSSIERPQENASVGGHQSAATKFHAEEGVVVEEVMDRDRWNRRVAVIKFPNGESLQGRQVEQGLARVCPQSGRFAFISDLLEKEKKARGRSVGLWKDWHYRIRDAASASDALGEFQLIEGVVKTASVHKGRVYLNFGADYRTDFTATASSRSARKWARNGPDILSASGKRIRMRGYVAWINGPSIEVLHPQQIELL